MNRRLLLALVLPLGLIWGPPAAKATAAGPEPLRPALAMPLPALSDKESFMLMFGKGNGAMRLLCLLERDGLMDRATRRRYSRILDQLISERGDSEADRRHLRIGMAMADNRPAVCPSRVMGRSDP